MEWLILFVLIIGILVFLAKGKGIAPAPDEFPYQRHETLFTPAERSFYGVLCQATAEKAVVFGKVRVADVIKPVGGLDRSTWQKAFNRISAKHFDYVLCKPDDLSVVAAIELDDKSHGQKKRIARDELLEGVCLSSGLILHRFIVSSGYSINDIRDKLFPSPVEKIEPITKQKYESRIPPVKEPVITESKGFCPKCSSELVKRIASKGKHKGSEFIACSAYPKCRYVAKQVAQSGSRGSLTPSPHNTLHAAPHRAFHLEW